MSTDRTPAYRAISDSIRDDILARRVVPGDRLPIETDLAEKFGVSRSTVREALRELASQNLVETIRGATGGTFVVVPRHEDLAQSLAVGIQVLANSTDVTVGKMLEARELLEVPAARYAGERGTEDQLDAIQAYVEGRRAEQEAGRQLRTNWGFHTLLVRAANNELIELMAEPIFRVLKTRFARITAPASFSRQVELDHREIAAALLERNGEAAAAAMRDHLAYLRPSYKEFDSRLGR